MQVYAGYSTFIDLGGWVPDHSSPVGPGHTLQYVKCQQGRFVRPGRCTCIACTPHLAWAVLGICPARDPAARRVQGGIAIESPFGSCDEEECDIEFLGAKVPLQRVSLPIPEGLDVSALTFVLRSEVRGDLVIHDLIHEATHHLCAALRGARGFVIHTQFMR